MRWISGRLAAASLLFAVSAPTALSGPVLVYRTGKEFCPRDRPADAPRISAEEAVARAKVLLPAEFCGPSFFVSGCDFDPETAHDTWRVFALQYKLVGTEKRYGGLDHSYVVLDAVGNCIANIPGT